MVRVAIFVVLNHFYEDQFKILCGRSGFLHQVFTWLNLLSLFFVTVSMSIGGIKISSQKKVDQFSLVPRIHLFIQISRYIYSMNLFIYILFLENILILNKLIYQTRIVIVIYVYILCINFDKSDGFDKKRNSIILFNLGSSLLCKLEYVVQ